MEAGEELDALIAEKIFGFKLIDRFTGKEHKILSGIALHYLQERNMIKPFSTDIKAAWEVVDSISGNKSFVSWEMRCQDIDMESYSLMGTSYSVYFCLGNGVHWKYSKSAPHAICLAALKAKGIEV